MGNSNVLSRIEDTQKVGQRETQDHWPIFQHGLFGQLNTPTPWLALLLVLGKSRVKQNSC